MGNAQFGNTPPYFDKESLLLYLENYAKAHPTSWRMRRAQSGTAGYVELREADSQTIADIGKAEVTVQLYGDADDAATNALTYTLVYLDADGDSHTAVGTGTATLNGTPVAFVPAVTDFYSAVSFTASAAQAVVTVSAKVAAGSIFATIATTATTATEAALWGVGSITFKSAADNAGDRAKDAYLCYLNNLYEIKYAICTTGAAASDVVRWYEATYAAGVYTATTTSVKDFYKLRTLKFSVVATGRMLIYDLGGSTTIYGVIKAANWEQLHTRYCCPAGYDAWIIGYKLENSTTADSKVKETWTSYGDSLTSSFPIELPKAGGSQCEQLIRVAAQTEVKWELIGNTAEVSFCYEVIEIPMYNRFTGGALL